MKNKYDLIFSIGCSCCSASQLSIRNKRHCSLPFDWLFFRDSSTLYKLAECFNEDFKNFFLFDNLKELTANDRGDGDKYQYQDTYTGYRFIHDFGDFPKEKTYKYNKEKYTKRIKRLYTLIEKSKNVLLLCDTTFDIEINALKALRKALCDKFKNVDFDIQIIKFDKKIQTDEVVDEHIFFTKYNRYQNKYDFCLVINEFDFLDSIDYSDNKILDQLDEIKKKSPKRRFIDKIRYKIWNHLGKKLRKKGII